MTVIPESKRITYVYDSGSSDDLDLLSDLSDNGEATDFMIVETGSGILLMVHQTSKYSC